MQLPDMQGPDSGLRNGFQFPSSFPAGACDPTIGRHTMPLLGDLGCLCAQAKNRTPARTMTNPKSDLPYCLFVLRSEYIVSSPACPLGVSQGDARTQERSSCWTIPLPMRLRPGAAFQSRVSPRFRLCVSVLYTTRNVSIARLPGWLSSSLARIGHTMTMAGGFVSRINPASSRRSPISLLFLLSHLGCLGGGPRQARRPSSCARKALCGPAWCQNWTKDEGKPFLATQL